MWNDVLRALRGSMDRVIDRVAMLLPGILAFVVVLLISIGIGWLLARIAIGILRVIHFDERMARGTRTLTEWSPRYTPTILVARIVFWCTVLLWLLVGIEAFGASSNIPISDHIIAYLPNVISAIVLLILGNIIARFLARSVLIGAVNMNLQYARLLSIGVKWLVLVLTAAMILDHLEIGAAVVDLAFGILFGGIVFAMALAVGLGSRELISRSLGRDSSRAGHDDNTEPEERVRHF